MYSYLYVTAGLSEASADHPRTSSVQEKCGPTHQSQSIAVHLPASHQGNKIIKHLFQIWIYEVFMRKQNH